MVGFKCNVVAKIYDESGKLLHKQKGHNAITDATPVSSNNGRALVLDRMFNSGDYYDPDDFINVMRLGDTAPTDASIGSQISVDKTITLGSMNISALAAPSLTVTGTWGAAEGALSGILSAGLYADGVGDMLFAYKAFSPALAKSAGGTLAIEWTVTVG